MTTKEAANHIIDNLQDNDNFLEIIDQSIADFCVDNDFTQDQIEDIAGLIMESIGKTIK